MDLKSSVLELHTMVRTTLGRGKIAITNVSSCNK